MEKKESLTDIEYQFQYFGFDVEEFCNDFKDLIKTFIKDIFKAEKQLFMQLNYNAEVLEDIFQLLDETKKQYLDAVSSSLATIKPVIKKFFEIPKNVVANEDEIYNTTEGNNVERLENEIKEMEAEFVPKRIYMEFLEQQLCKIEAIKPLQEHALFNFEEFKGRETNE